MPDPFNVKSEGVKLDPDDIFRPHATAEIDSTRTWVDPKGYRLSDRLWRAGKADRAQIDTLLRSGLARGASPLETAKSVEHLLNPYYTLRRDPETHRILPKSQQPKGVATTTPRQGPGRGPFRPRNSGTGSYAARRLARTETTRAFGDATLKAGKANPFMERIRWRKSGHHFEPDQCDLNASHSSKDQPPGVYFVDEVPRYPDHPHEMCTLNPYVTQEDINSAIPRIREFIRTGTIPERGFTETGLPLIPQIATPVAKGNPIYQRQMRQLRDEYEGATTYAEREQAITRAGQITRKRLFSKLAPADRERFTELSNATKELAAADKEFQALNKRIYDPKTAKMPEAEFEALHAKYQDARFRRDSAHIRRNVAEIGASNPSTTEHTGNPIRNRLLDTIEEIRPTAAGDSAQHIHGGFSDPIAERALHSVRNSVPQEWWDQSVEFGPIESRVIGRAHYLPAKRRGDLAELNVSGDTAYQYEVAKHEFMHRVEQVRPELAQAEHGFWERRTAGETTGEMAGYAADEVTRPDKFIHPYMGKDYGTAHYHEIASMGVQDVMRTDGKVPNILVGDEDMLDFILGLLVIG